MKFKYCGPNGTQVMHRKLFSVSVLKYSDLDLRPCDPKMNRALVPNMDNHPMKFEH
jgi:hypothetical protein